MRTNESELGPNESEVIRKSTKKKMKKEKKGNDESTPTGSAKTIVSAKSAPNKTHIGKSRHLREGGAPSPATPTRKDSISNPDLHANLAEGRDQDQDQRGQNHDQQRINPLVMDDRQSLALSQYALKQRLEKCLLSLEGSIDVLDFVRETYEKQLSIAKKTIEDVQILMHDSGVHSAIR
jgi:hypothetical protein